MKTTVVWYGLLIAIHFVSDAGYSHSLFQSTDQKTTDDSILVEKIFFSNTPANGNNEIYMLYPNGSSTRQLTK